MRAHINEGRVVLVLDPGEATRLAAALAETGASMSRAEFFIRTGGSAPNIEAIAEQLAAVASGRSDGFEVPVVAGVESEENPRRPRPGRD